MEEKYVNNSNAQSKKDYILDKLKDGVQTQDYYITATEDGKVIVYEGSNDSGREISKVFVDENGSIQWQEDISTYTIAYDGNGATGGNMEASVCNYDEESTLIVNGFTKTDCKFLGWNTAVDGSGTAYEDGQSILNLTERGYTVTLYAQWKEEIQLATAIITTATYGEEVDYSANGITGWKTFLNDGKNVYIISSDAVPIGGLTLTAGLKKVGSYGINYNGNRTGVNRFLTNTSNWVMYANGMSGGKKITGLTVTGGPTEFQFWASYNGKYKTNFKGEIGMGGQAGLYDTLYFPHSGKWNECYGYYFAGRGDGSENAVFAAWFGRGTVMGGSTYCIRPLICLPSNMKAKKVDGKWVLSN